MACYHPIPARRSENGGPWTLYPKGAQVSPKTDVGSNSTADATIPCGKCLGCRTRNQLEWTLRCVHEAKLHQHNRFVTLTYSDEHLPNELDPAHLTSFLKKLRDHAQRDPNIRHDPRTNIRYLACGEYGERTLRPHYHLNLFNLAFADEQRYGADLYTSATLDKLWGKGATKLAPFSAATAGYVAGYITKHGRQTYADADGVVLRDPFKRQSTNPAIGRNYVEKFLADLHHGYVIHEGRKQPLPRYYKKLIAKIGGNSNQILGNALAEPAAITDKYTPERLTDAEYIHADNLKKKGARDLCG